MATERIRVMCVDDNPLVAEGVRIKLNMEGGFEWAGHRHTADDLCDWVRRWKPDIVLLDIDTPGADALTSLAELAEAVPDTKTVILSGYSQEDFLERAIAAGAWGYVSKNDGPDQVVQAIRLAADGKFAFGQTVLQQCIGGR